MKATWNIRKTFDTFHALDEGGEEIEKFAFPFALLALCARYLVTAIGRHQAGPDGQSRLGRVNQRANGDLNQ